MRLSNSFESLFPTLDGEQAFNIYEDVVERLPSASYPSSSDLINNLSDIAENIDAFVFDAFGVLNVGEETIAGAVERVADLRRLGKRLFVLTNAASYNRDQTFEKFNRLGFDFDYPELVTSRNAAELGLDALGTDHYWGVAGTSSFHVDELEANCVKLLEDPSAYDAATAFLFLSVSDWTAERQELLERSISRKNRPVIIANPDIVAPRGNNVFSTEPGYFGHRLATKYGTEVYFHGKPFPSVYDIVEQRLAGSDIAADRICMVGDTLHTDVLGGASRGWKTVLVTDHGLFKGLNSEDYIAKSGIRPHFKVSAI